MREITGMRVARSALDGAISTIDIGDLDFQLAPNGGIKIFGVLGLVAELLGPSTSAHASANFRQSLHLETGALEDTPWEDGDGDAVAIDTEIIYEQIACVQGAEESATRGGTGYSATITPNGMLWFPEPFLSARNLRHRVECDAVAAFNGILLVYYKHVIFTLEEMGTLLARRT